MQRKTFLKAALLSLGLVTIGWVTAAAAAPTGKAVGGKTFGNWDLPSGWGSGLATGALNDGLGNTVFKLEAKLVEVPSPAKYRQGTMDGVLDDGSPYPWPQFGVNGNWTSNLSGKGTFEAVITFQISPLGPIAVIGKMAGVFKDPGAKVGKYEGEWKALLP